MSRFRVTMSTALLAFAMATTGGAQQGEPPAEPAPGDIPPEMLEQLSTLPRLPSAEPKADQKKEKDDDETMTWSSFMQEWLKPRPTPRKSVVFLDDGYARPHPAITLRMEVVREEGDTVWLRGIPPEKPASPLHQLWLNSQAREMLIKAQLEWEAKYGDDDYYLDFSEPLVPPGTIDGIRFERVAADLPTRGRWQMGFDVADMNGDGALDLVFPPTRAGSTRPTVFLGDGDGGFEAWAETRWPSQVPLDYGDVAVADFDLDGNLDIVIAIHFKTQWIMYGDGAGDFTRARKLPNPDPRLTSRAVTVADFNGDGRPDPAFLAELDFDMSSNVQVEDVATAWVVLNLDGTFFVETEGLPEDLIGDNIEAADFDGDGRPDLLLSSNTVHKRNVVYHNRPNGWEPAFAYGLLSNSYHFDLDVVEARDGVVDSVYGAFVQFRQFGGENQARTGVIRYEVDPATDGLHSPGGPVFFDDRRYDPMFRVGVGDLDGDGRADVVAARKEGGAMVFVQPDDGVFYLERSPELEMTGRAYDLQLVDLDGDGRDDLVAALAELDDSPGGVRVWLSRPAAEER